MNPENPSGGNDTVTPIGRGHEIREEKIARRQAIIDEFDRALAYHKSLPGKALLRNRWAEDTKRMIDLLCHHPEDMNEPRKYLVEELLGQAAGIRTPVGSNSEELLYSVGEECLRKAIIVYQDDGGAVDINF